MYSSNLDSRDLYFNREISWIEFNKRVLDEAMDSSNPLLEQLKFLSIFYNNLDEFFMVRVSNLYKQYMSGTWGASSDRMTPAKTLALIRRKIVPLLSLAQSFWGKTLRGALYENGVRIVGYDDLQDKHKKFLQGYYQSEIYPILTPQAIDPGRPFPIISNESLNILVELSSPIGETCFARLKIPNNISRFLFIPRNKEAKAHASLGFSSNANNNDILFLEDIIYRNLDSLFPGYQVVSAATFRITRNTDFEIETDEADDLLETIRDLVDQRRFGEVIRLEISHGAASSLSGFLIKRLNLLPFQIYRVKGPLGCGDLMELCKVERPDLKDPPHSPRIPAPFNESRVGVFAMLRRYDLMLYHPYDSFTPVLDFLRRAADDPQVIAIKQTIYRVGSESPIVDELVRARRNGKQVTAVVELKARFDEERNIKWADTLEEEGLHVVYGLIGMKIHAKLCLVLRRESDGIRRYVHIGTGNYNPTTAKTYTDLGLFTSNEEICADVTDLFNHMTGFARNNSYRKLLVSPLSTRAGVISRIDREIQIHQERGGGKIFFKINHLVDQACIEALYRASRAGVEVRLQVRGICCLRPGISDVSENITVTSLVGRFLEHTRIYWFGNGGGGGEMFIGSADLMPRNLDRRVEVLTPVLDTAVRKTILEDIMLTHMNDNVKARTLRSDGSYEKAPRRGGELSIDSQQIMTRRECGWNPLLTFDGDGPEVDSTHAPHLAHGDKKLKLMKPKDTKSKKKEAKSANVPSE